MALLLWLVMKIVETFVFLAVVTFVVGMFSNAVDDFKKDIEKDVLDKIKK
jgi:hypothetical protein